MAALPSALERIGFSQLAADFGRTLNLADSNYRPIGRGSHGSWRRTGYCNVRIHRNR